MLWLNMKQSSKGLNLTSKSMRLHQGALYKNFKETAVFP